MPFIMSRSLFKCICLLKSSLKSSIFAQKIIISKLHVSKTSYFYSHRSLLKEKQDGLDDEKIDRGSEEVRIIRADGFDNVQDKNKTAFLDLIDFFKRRDPKRAGLINFIYSALKHMREFGVHRDLQVYKELIDILPKGKYVPTSFFQSEYQYYPREQQCIVDLLEQMEVNAVVPDWEMEALLISIFGNRGHPVRRYWRMMYWMPKFKNLSPWPLPNPVPNDAFELAKLAITRIMSVDVQSEVKVFKTSDVKASIDDTWIVSGQSPVQQKLIEAHSVDKPIYVEGGFRIYLHEMPLLYFILRSEPDKSRQVPVHDDYKADNVSELRIPFLTTPQSTKEDDIVNMPSVHEQEDGTIFAVCATGSSSKDSLLSWIRCLEKNGNPKLEKIPILFTFKSPIGATVPIDEDYDTDEKLRLDERRPLIES